MPELIPKQDYRYKLSQVYLPAYGHILSQTPQERMFDWITSFEFLLEELIANSASEIVLTADAKQFVTHFKSLGFPMQLLKRIRFVDASRAIREAKSITSPLYEEFSVREVSLDDGTITWRGHDEHITSAVLTVNQNLKFLLLGLRYKLQIDARINEVKDALSTIIQRTKYAEIRANMSILQGVFNCYDTLTLNTLGVSDVRRDDKLMEQFLSFVQDEEFKQLSNANYCLGFPHLLKKAIIRVNQTARKAILNEKFSGLFSLLSKTVNVAYRIPEIDAPKIVNLFWGWPYLPPIIDLRPIYSKSRTRWENWKTSVYPKESQSSKS